MKTKTTRILSIQDPQAISIAAKIIGQGGLVVFPTDTIYGLAADPWNGQAIQDIYTAKGRPQEKAIPVLIGSLPQLSLITQSLSDKMLTLATSFWPGPLTLVLPKKESLPEELSQYTRSVFACSITHSLSLYCSRLAPLQPPPPIFQAHPTR